MLIDAHELFVSNEFVTTIASNEGQQPQSVAGAWWWGLLLGALLILLYSWSRFDESSSDRQTECLARYQPRFSTSHLRYQEAKFGYLAVVLGLYLLFSWVPNLLDPSGESATVKFLQEANLTSPLAVAVYIISIQNIPFLKEFEQKLRSIFHSIARIPEGVRRLIGRMKGSEFKFEAAPMATQLRKIAGRLGSNAPLDRVIRLVERDEILSSWSRTGCILYQLSDGNRVKVGIDTLFLEHYNNEYENIKSTHEMLAEPVRRRFERLLQQDASAPSDAQDLDDPALQRELRKLSEQLFAFVACGAQSSVKTDAESVNILRKLGFSESQIEGGQANVSEIASLLLLLICFLGAVFALISGLLDQEVKKALHLDYVVEHAWLKAFLFFVSTALFYFSAIVGALWARGRRIGRREWFDINAREKRLPIAGYLWATVSGTVAGSAWLFLVAFLGGPGFESCGRPHEAAVGINLYVTKLYCAIIHASPWFLLALLMALFALVLSDHAETVEDDRTPWTRFLVQDLIAAIAVASVALLVQEQSVRAQAIALSGWKAAVAALFFPANIFAMVFVMCLIVQLYKFHNDEFRRTIGARLQAVSQEGASFALCLERSGRRASCFAAKERSFDEAHATCRGVWTLYPEGMVVRWNAEPGENGESASNLGLILSSDGSLTYKGFSRRIAGTPDFVAQLDVKAAPSPAPA